MIAIGLLSGIIVMVAGVILSAAISSLTAPDPGDQARSVIVGMIALTMLVTPIATGFAIWRREQALCHGLGAMLLVGAAPWALLGIVTLFAVSNA